MLEVPYSQDTSIFHGRRKATSRMKKRNRKHKGLENHLFVLGIFFSIIYWLLQSFVRSYIFLEGTFLREVFTRDSNELWMRCLVVFIITIFTFYVQYIVRRLNKAEEDLQYTREEFIAVLTHDLKSPLASIMSYARLITEPRLGEISPNKREFAQVISKSGDIMLQLINNIISISKIEAGLMKYNFETFPLSELFNELKETFEPLAMEGSLSLEFANPEEISIRGDRIKLRQVFYNLISNSLRYTPPGGQIDISASMGDGRVAVEVCDSGTGIPEVDQETVFDKFAQVQGERSGTGLGLYIVKNFLSGHGSDVLLVSTRDKGTKFFFTLPRGTE
jgi:signal transduction histidine kinase